MMNKSFNLSAVILLVFLIGFFLEETIDSSKFSNYESLEETLEIISELFSVFVALSIFAITWHAYSNSGDNHSLFLGTTFLITGLLTLCHLLSYTFMPDFITPNSPHKAAIFFLESRFILAFLLLASVYVHNDSFPKLIDRNVMFFFAAAILSVSMTSVWFYHDFLFWRFNLDTYSTETVFLLFIITGIILVTGYLYNKKAKETFQTNLNYLAEGSIILLVSNLAYFSYEFSAHFLIITGFVYFYLGLYKTSVELPYERLAISEEKLRRAAEGKYRKIVETSTEGIWMLDASSKTSYVNSRMAQMLGNTEEEMLGRHVFDFMDADARIEAEKCLERLKQGIKETLDFRFSRKDRTNLWAIVSTNPIFDEKGQYVGALGMITDISERKQAEEIIKKSLEEKEVLLREIHHRVKNNMQIISSLLGLTSGTIKEKKYIEMFRESQNRINSMSLIHEKLYSSNDFAKIDFNEYIRELANSLFKSRGITGIIELKIDIENVSIGIDHAIPCGLIINELITNSIKYAFPGDRKGEIKVSLHLNDENMNELVVSDNGVGIPEYIDFRKTESLGLRLVTILVENQLNGTIDMDRNNGTEFKIKFKRG
jgi:PAS domain S-box-containing protein